MDSKHTRKPRATLADLPPELCDHITHYLPTASSIASLGRTSKSLHSFVEKDAWNTFSRSHFPSICPTSTPSGKETARTLTTLSRAWDRRAFVARCIEPQGVITAHPGRRKVEKWIRPKGQTIGFAPQLDVYDEIGTTWRDRNETLAFTAGAEVCIRQTKRYDSGEDVRWTTYRPHSAREGRDDVTTMHLLRPASTEDTDIPKVITGTANGDLQLIGLPSNDSNVRITYFATQGMPVRNSSLWQEESGQRLLASSLGDSRLALYHMNDDPKISPSSQMDIVPPLRADGNPSTNHRIWSTDFLSPSTVAVGVGPSTTPIHVYAIAEAGLIQAPLRKLALQGGDHQKRMSSVYTTVPLPSSMVSSGNGDVFLSGAYDGIVRLHDLRSHREVEQTYVDPVDDSPIYTILPRGQEQFLAGTNRHNLLKVMDLRLGAKRYDYMDAASITGKPEEPCTDYNIFLRPSNSPVTPSRGGNWSTGSGRTRFKESSVYSLASPSSHSPYIYAGVENAIWSLAFTEMLDPHPDPVYFEPWSAKKPDPSNMSSRVLRNKEVQDLAMYGQNSNMKLCVQRSLWDTWKSCGPRHKGLQHMYLDERWKGADDSGGRNG